MAASDDDGREARREEEWERTLCGRALDPRRHSPTTGALQTHTAHEGDLTHAPKPTSRVAIVKARLGIESRGRPCAYASSSAPNVASASTDGMT